MFTSVRLILVGFNQNEKNAFEGALKLSAANTSALDALAKAPNPSGTIPAMQLSTNGSLIDGVFVEILQGDITCESTEEL